MFHVRVTQPNYLESGVPNREKPRLLRQWILTGVDATTCRADIAPRSGSTDNSHLLAKVKVGRQTHITYLLLCQASLPVKGNTTESIDATPPFDGLDDKLFLAPELDAFPRWMITPLGLGYLADVPGLALLATTLILVWCI